MLLFCGASPGAARLDASRLTVGAVVLVLGWPSRYRLVEVNAHGWWFVPLSQPDMRPFKVSSGATKVLSLAGVGGLPQGVLLPVAQAEDVVHKSPTPIDARADSAPAEERRKRGRPCKSGPVSRWTARRRAQAQAGL